MDERPGSCCIYCQAVEGRPECRLDGRLGLCTDSAEIPCIFKVISAAHKIPVAGAVAAKTNIAESQLDMDEEHEIARYAVATCGCRDLHPAATDDSIPPPSKESEGDASLHSAAEQASEIIVRFLRNQGNTPVMPKHISLHTHLNPNTAKSECRRLRKKGVLVREATGYMLPSNSFDYEIERMLKMDGKKQTLPKFHDIHLCFKTENLQKAHELPERGPGAPGLQKAQISGCKNIPSLPPGFFDPGDSGSIYRRWMENARYAGTQLQSLSGGYQECYSLPDYSIKFQIYVNTGTIKIIIGNSESPFDIYALDAALQAIDGIFIARTGQSFGGISQYFYFELVHVGNDIKQHIDLEGISKLNLTIHQFKEIVFRIYEKVMKGEPYLRSEACVRGTYEDSPLAAVYAELQGTVTPTQNTAQIYMQGKNIERLEQAIRRQQYDFKSNNDAISSLIQVASKQSEQINEIGQTVRALLTGKEDADRKRLGFATADETDAGGGR